MGMGGGVRVRMGGGGSVGAWEGERVGETAVGGRVRVRVRVRVGWGGGVRV
jgi:hypothetical protein